MEIIKKKDILYEDKDFVAINKPAGVVVHPDGKAESEDPKAKKKDPVLTDWIIKHYPKTKNVGEPIVMTNGTVIARPGIVHRLDKGTSGVILVAKTKAAHAYLKEQFQNREVTKKYFTFVYGEFEDKYGTINRPIGRSKSDFRKWSAQRGARGEMREAETWYTVLGSGRAHHSNEDDDRSGGTYSFLEVEPKTGRTHQIRVHLKAVNHPVVCDDLYAPERPCAFGFGRTALHAYSLELKKMDGSLVKIEAPLPADFKKALKELNIPEPK
jgi:23S rRNA pseudouridine1911/1915/1917 synthase